MVRYAKSEPLTSTETHGYRAHLLASGLWKPVDGTKRTCLNKFYSRWRRRQMKRWQSFSTMRKTPWVTICYTSAPSTAAVSELLIAALEARVEQPFIDNCCLDEIMDALFDIMYLECDPLNRDKETPLHTAVRFADDKDPNELIKAINMMCEAGCDPRMKNKYRQKPVDLVSNNPEIKKILQKSREHSANSRSGRTEALSRRRVYQAGGPSEH